MSMLTPPNPMTEMGQKDVPDWLWWRTDRPIRIRWVMLGHTRSPAPHEMERYTASDYDRATAVVDTYDAKFTVQRSQEEIPTYIGSPITPPVVVPPPPGPPAPLPPRAGEPCPTCGHICPRPLP